ncbi:hypothetical protein [Millisia brevis]|uniref:hypothetical protein n=1 Tax=Millisia brevis TaxID=264148 RepID=UPI00082C44C1|nr:hypothetical protein [Millisia brevis]
MGFWRRRLDGYRDGDYAFRIACRLTRIPASAAAIPPTRRAVDRPWTEPVHATTHGGIAVTVSFGLGMRDGQVLLCGGHVTASDFFAMERDGMIEPHRYRVDGLPATPEPDGFA